LRRLPREPAQQQTQGQQPQAPQKQNDHSRAKGAAAGTRTA